MKKYLEYLCCILLSATIILLCVVLMLNMKTTNNNGHYQVAGNSSNTCWVIDTETGQLWLRTTSARGYDLGTSSSPHRRELGFQE
jgi:hypothetical protein